MTKAFIFGKFMPFHKGHEAMLNFALTKCDFLSVLVCCSDKETIPAETRKSWIDATFKSVHKIEVRVFNYKETDLPNTSESSQEVSRLWSQKFKVIYPNYNLLITSEPYGDYVASFMKIKHIPFDIARQRYPVSATAVRDDLFANFNFLPKAVKPYFAIKVVVLGTESTGKSSLVKKLVQHYNCSKVTEVGRTLIANSKQFQFTDLTLVAKEHAKQINQKVCGESPLVIIDTDVHTTMSYARFIFNKELKIDDTIYKTNKADLYLYLNNDVTYVQDGTRLSEADRNLLDASHRNILKEKNIKYIEIKGNWEERLEKSVEEINSLVSPQKNE